MKISTFLVAAAFGVVATGAAAAETAPAAGPPPRPRPLRLQPHRPQHAPTGTAAKAGKAGKAGKVAKAAKGAHAGAGAGASAAGTAGLSTPRSSASGAGAVAAGAAASAGGSDSSRKSTGRCTACGRLRAARSVRGIRFDRSGRTHGSVGAAGGLLGIAVLAGGGPRGMGDLLVQAAALPCLAMGLWRWRWSARVRGSARSSPCLHRSRRWPCCSSCRCRHACSRRCRSARASRPTSRPRYRSRLAPDDASTSPARCAPHSHSSYSRPHGSPRPRCPHPRACACCASCWSSASPPPCSASRRPARSAAMPSGSTTTTIPSARSHVRQPQSLRRPDGRAGHRSHSRCPSMPITRGERPIAWAWAAARSCCSPPPRFPIRARASRSRWSRCSHRWWCWRVTMHGVGAG